MSFNVESTTYFEKQIKKLLKKFPSLKKEFSDLVSLLKKEPFQGKAIGNNCYKIRLAISSKGKGKSGGARIITHVKIINSKVYLLSIYDKSDQSDISDKDLESWVKFIS